MKVMWKMSGMPALLLAGALAACGDAEDSVPADAATEPDTAQVEAADTMPGPAGSSSRRGNINIPEETEIIEVTLSEWDVALSKTSITSGPVTLLIRNEGEMPHVLEIMGEYAGRNRSAPIAAGDTVLMAMPLSAGRYTVYCPRAAEDGPDHRTRGMEARLLVR